MSPFLPWLARSMNESSSSPRVAIPGCVFYYRRQPAPSGRGIEWRGGRAMDVSERDDPIELEVAEGGEGGARFRAGSGGDRRPRMPEPLPVRVLAVEDVRLPATAGLEPQLDDFYVGLFGFERVDVELPRPRLKVEPLPGVRNEGSEWPVIRRGRAGLPAALLGADRP